MLEAADEMEKGIAGAKKVVFPGTAHMLSMEQPEKFATVVLGFLEGLSADEDGKIRGDDTKPADANSPIVK